MNNSATFELFLTYFSHFIPTLVACLVAALVILAKGARAPAAALWAVLGFGLGLVLCFVLPFGQTMLQLWVFQGEVQETRMWAITTFSWVGSLLHAAVYLILLVAVFTGRAQPQLAAATVRIQTRMPMKRN